MEDVLETFEELPYESLPIPATSPEHLAVASLLHGGPRPRRDGYRYLELGCGDGSNLLALAFYRPECEFVGIDGARSHLERARESAKRIGVTNLEFLHGDLESPGFAIEGEYDYVAAHGVFSWVPEPARRNVLRAYETALAPDGLGYLSFNCHPGWKLRGLVRESLMQAVEGIADLRERVQRAKEVARTLREIIGEVDHPWQVMLAHELERLPESTESYLFHEYLCPVNDAFYHRDVVARMESHGLRWLADSYYNRAEGFVPFDFRKRLDNEGFGGLKTEQCVDLLLYRQFRASVLCRAEVEPEVRPLPLDDLLVATPLEPENAEPDLDPEVEETFHAPEEVKFTTYHPVLKRALARLAPEWPRSLPIAEISESNEQAVELATFFSDLHKHSLARIRLAPGPEPAAATGPSPHALASFEADRNKALATSLHTLVRLQGFEQETVRMAGRGVGREEIPAKLLELSAEGELEIELPEGKALPAEDAPAALLELVEDLFDRLARWGLLA